MINDVMRAVRCALFQEPDLDAVELDVLGDCARHTADGGTRLIEQTNAASSGRAHACARESAGTSMREHVCDKTESGEAAAQSDEGLTASWQRLTAAAGGMRVERPSWADSCLSEDDRREELGELDDASSGERHV